jgi:hypothetical protein
MASHIAHEMLLSPDSLPDLAYTKRFSMQQLLVSSIANVPRRVINNLKTRLSVFALNSLSHV